MQGKKCLNFLYFKIQNFQMASDEETTKTTNVVDLEGSYKKIYI